MPGTILSTKLSIPLVRPATLNRDLILKRLDQGQSCKLTLISAPAGFGKTTLLGGWATCCTAPLGWVSLDETDNDPIRFFSYIFAALQKIDPDLTAGLAASLQSPQPPPLDELVAALIVQVAAHPGEHVLVVDDFHLICSHPIHSAITALLEGLPSNLHLYISTRADPPLPLARLRSQDQLVELYSPDLRLSLEETGLFMERALEQSLDIEDIKSLSGRTEGWVMGLQMAALALHSCQDMPGFIKDFTASNRFILDYLLETVLQRQPPQIQSFLLQTSGLERLSGALCDAVTGQPGSLQILSKLERDALFTCALDKQSSWFKYHSLFADMLQRRQRQSCPEAIYKAHKRASQWYEQNGLFLAAIESAFKAQDIPLAAGLVETHAKSLWNSGGQATLFRWLQALPDEVVRTRPRLAIYRALDLSTAGLQQAAGDYLKNAETGLNRQDFDQTQEDRGMLEKIRTAIQK
jgi:LuxR family transcriptional regulator, maltose regulon positive regulatory protein